METIVLFTKRLHKTTTMKSLFNEAYGFFLNMEQNSCGMARHLVILYRKPAFHNKRGMTCSGVVSASTVTFYIGVEQHFLNNVIIRQ